MFGTSALSELPLGALPDDAATIVVTQAPVVVADASAVGEGSLTIGAAGLAFATTQASASAHTEVEASGVGHASATTWARAVVRLDIGDHIAKARTWVLPQLEANSSVLAICTNVLSPVIPTRKARSQVLVQVVQAETVVLEDAKVLVEVESE